MNQKMLISNGFINVPFSKSFIKQDVSLVTTVVSNMAYYGYMPSMDVIDLMQYISRDQLTTLWHDIEVALKELTGASKNMDSFVVYKNFPKEVLEKSQAEYWMAQILMYWGLPNEIFTQVEDSREPMLEKMKLKVLSLSPEKVYEKIYTNLKGNTSRWANLQTEHAKSLVDMLKVKSLNVDDFSFKENGIVLANEILSKFTTQQEPQTALAQALKKKGMRLSNSNISSQVNLKISNATDVLRLAAAMSEGDISLREKVRFKKFSRPVRKFLLELLEESKNLQEDCTMRPEVWKKFLACLHPGDYKFVKVQKAYDIIYRNDFTTFNGKVSAHLEKNEVDALKMLESRPGEFLRKLHHMYKVYDMEAVRSFLNIIPKLSTLQLIKLDSYILTINYRFQLIYPPKGNWNKARFVDNNKKQFSVEAHESLHNAISAEIGSRLDAKFPQGVDLDMNLANVKLQTNDQKLSSYGRGTTFKIPDEMKFIRSASYWEHKACHSTWFDNGWNFFDGDWKSMSTCCWNSTSTIDIGAVFSGDPTNAKDLKGRACQMIDLDLAKLEASGVNYAVWNILCFSNIAFDSANEVLATLQWGEEAQSGKLFEPSRAQMVFPVTGKSLTKYIAYIDVKRRELVYIDADFDGEVSSAKTNGKTLSKKMPAFVEYLNTLPSIAELFMHAKKGSMPVWLNDESKSIDVDSEAFVFNKLNPENTFKQLDLSKVLN